MTSSPSRAHHLAMKHLKQHRQHAWTLRLEFLATVEELTALQDDKKKAKITRTIRNREQRTRTFHLLHLYTHLEKQDGVKEVKVPTDSNANPRDPNTSSWRTISNQSQVKDAIYCWNSQHFSKAKTTPFLSLEFKELCGYNGITSFPLMELLTSYSFLRQHKRFCLKSRDKPRRWNSAILPTTKSKPAFAIGRKKTQHPPQVATLDIGRHSSRPLTLHSAPLNQLRVRCQMFCFILRAICIGRHVDMAIL